METKPKNTGKFAKGNQGKPKGAVNKTTKALKEMILQALNDQPGGGVAYLKIQAVENPTAFMSLLGKVLPTTLAGDKENPLEVVTQVKLVALSA